jgi:hypothetical protein
MHRSQTVPIFTLTSYTTTGLSSPPFDSLSHICYGNTIDISLFRYIQIGVQPKTTITLTGDTLKFTLQDTALTILTLDGIVRFDYTLSGLESKYYVAKFFGKLYEIDCRYVGIDKYKRDKIYSKEGNLIKLNSPNQCNTKIYDFNGKLILSSNSELINLTEFNLQNGIYLIEVTEDRKLLREKILVE